ncbi:tyrosine-type recombinase/integrase [Shewanella subflava]|uniref:Site-specific integrase n=1 Tax=Shewanella subflava TaxID=2986476 RepID=A0ABT3IAD7_9GAMM|nr:site-specific integrase [Shewanella subflava]MCW3172899.1 site-specific integrase [Shewanella subflava]
MSKLIGKEARQQRRNRHQNNVLKKAKERSEKYFPSGANLPPSENIESIWLELTEDLTKIFRSQVDFKRAFNHCIALIKEKQSEINIPSYLITQKAESSIYTQTFIQDGLAFTWHYTHWFDNLSNNRKSNNIVDAYRDIIMSFICHSGCLNHHLLKALSNQLNGTLDISTINNLPFINLEIDEGGFNTNVVNSDKHSTQITCYLSPITISCISHYLTLKKVNKNALWQAPCENKNIHALIVENYVGPIPLANTLKKLAKSAANLISQTPNVRISQAIIEYSMGNNKAYSLPNNNLARLATCPTKQPLKLHFFTPLRQNKRKSKQRLTPNLPLSNFYQTLTEELKENAKKKLTSQSLSKRLENFVSGYDLSTEQEVLIKWFIDKLKTCKPSTIRTYHSTLSRKWLYQTEGINLEDAEEQDFQDLYNELIELTYYQKQKTKLAARLSDFHAFAVQEYDFPLLLEPISNDSQHKSHTNAGFVDETLFKALLDAADQIIDLDFKNKLVIKSILIISYRCGLRISETLKLRFIDIENSQEGWLKVRENKFGNNKSSSSLRKVPLYILLLEHEIKIVTASLNMSRQDNINGTENRLAFTIGQDKNQPIDRFLISNFTSTALRAISGLEHLVFHHLRHSAVSRLQFMFELGAEDCANYSEIVPYTAKQIDKITYIITGKTLRNKYYAIAAFDGHSSPETCFNHYFHFCDLILYCNLLKMRLDLTQKQLVNLGLGSRRHLRQFAQSKNKNECWRIDSFLDYTTKKLKITPIQAPDTKAPLSVSSESPKSPPKPIINIETCYSILAQIERGIDPIELAFKYHIEPNIIDKWCSNAKALMSIKTRYGSSRLQTKRSNQSLLPSKPNAKTELAWLDTIITKVRHEFPNNRQEILWGLDYALNNKSYSKSGIYFSSPDDLARFVDAFSFAISKNKWRVLTLSMKHSIQKKCWQNAYKDIQVVTSKSSSSKGRTGNGAVWLELRHSDEKDIIAHGKQKKHSSSSIIFLFHMMGIMMKKAENPQ